MSIFSRVKKPGPPEPRPPGTQSPSASPSPPRGDGSHPLPGIPPRSTESRPPGEHTPATRVTGFPAFASKPFEQGPAPGSATKVTGASNGASNGATNGASNGATSPKAAASPAAPTTVPKPAQPFMTALYGAANARAAASERPNGATAPKPIAVRESPSGPIDLVIEMAMEASAQEEEPPAIVSPGISTASDQAALRATFEDLAVPYMAEVRSLMMELQWEETQASWFELARPLIRSLRKMAEPVGHGALVEGLDRFDKAIADVLAPGQPSSPSPASREALLAAYAPLRACLPPAFDLEGERDRREPLIVRALLEQVQGLEPVNIEALVAAGFGKLSALYVARADEIAAVTGIGDVIAAGIAARVQAFRRMTPAGLASVDRTATLRDVDKLLKILRTQHAAFDACTRGWSEQDRSAKRQMRRERQQTLLQLTIELVRLGEVGLVQRLDKLPFGRKVEEIERFAAIAFQVERGKNRSPVPAPAAAAAPPPAAAATAT